jgi:1-phosphofructokinase family hexose kinase
MFLCISANPAIDKRLRVLKLTVGGVNRATEATFSPGGKAAHVAMVLQALKADPLWVGFVGGASGEALLKGFHELCIRVEAIPIQEPIRTNLEIHDDDGMVTEILEPGPALSPLEIEAFQNTCNAVFTKGNQSAYVILSGSLPPGLHDGFYATLIRRAQSHCCKVFLDTSRAPLRIALKEGPDFIKPNREEAEWLVGSPVRDARSAVAGVRYLLAEGAKSAAISLGKDGLVWSPGKDEAIYFAQPPVVRMRSAVGSGDSVVAAFAYAMSMGSAPEETIRMAAACGAANCFAESPGLVRAADISRMQGEVRVTEI